MSKDIKVNKTFEKRDNGEIWAVVTKEFINEEDLKTEIVHRQLVTKEYLEKELNEEIPSNLSLLDKNIAELEGQIKPLKEKIKEVINERDYINFKTKIKTPEYKKFASVYKVEGDIEQKQSLLDKANSQREGNVEVREHWKVMLKEFA